MGKVKKVIKNLFSLALVLVSTQVIAVPVLQLNILDGTYDTVDETIVTSDQIFTVQAYLTPSNNPELSVQLAETYYISIALVPQDIVADDYGKITVDDGSNVTDINVTGDMTYGNAPLSVVDHDLGGHGIFDTWYYELAFQFLDTSATTATVFNTQDNAGMTPDTSGSGMFIASFEINLSMLDLSGIAGVHFDLYNTKLKNGDTWVDNFAPFSHDAAFVVPEPDTLFLMGIGLIGLGFSRRKTM